MAYQGVSHFHTKDFCFPYAQASRKTQQSLLMQTAGGDVNCRVSHWGFTSLCISGWNKTLGLPLFLSGLMRFLLVGAFFIPEWAWQPPSTEALPLGMPSCSWALESILSTAQAVKSPIWLSDGCLLKCCSTCWRDGCMAHNFLLLSYSGNNCLWCAEH